MESLKKLVSSENGQNVLWALAFTGVTVLVALGKVKPETMEYMLFALVGKASGSKRSDGSQ
jgi:hypothetical protein